ncbi:IDEAL domain-containing protein [Heyndrickxia vini]|uniref:IDEAL domain-containing protein n=1 Tax=Heyndrickxia vini TaxID=1476025 RepID=A0ABX7DZ84_9BACI|nr:IDEAL domain-containing protein [Heyndrickxia vini]QQZ08270.1 IDEAL domain-containing protein [Heyndrickxia vini]
MEKKESYTEMVNAYAMTQIKNEKFMAEIYAEMILNELLLTRRKEVIVKKIDLALDCKDKRAFLLLTDELKELEKQFGS